jgi:hypothetical protein
MLRFCRPASGATFAAYQEQTNGLGVSGDSVCCQADLSEGCILAVVGGLEFDGRIVTAGFVKPPLTDRGLGRTNRCAHFAGIAGDHATLAAIAINHPVARLRRTPPTWSADVDADVQVKIFGEEMLEFAAFDDAQPVVTRGEGLGFCADPGRGDQDAAVRPFFVHRPGEGADVIGGHALAVPLGLDQDLGLAHDVGLVVGDGVDALVAGGLGNAHFQAHGLEQLADQVLELVPVHL